jgi:hypothetical protein
MIQRDQRSFRATTVAPDGLVVWSGAPITLASGARQPYHAPKEPEEYPRAGRGTKERQGPNVVAHNGIDAAGREYFLQAALRSPP